MITTIEGPSGVGKSTIAKELGNSNPNIKIIGEYGDFLYTQDPPSFPSFPPKSLLEIYASNLMWGRIDVIRSNLCRSAEVSLLDRSVICLFAFEYAKMRQGYIGDIRNLAAMYMSLYTEGSFLGYDRYIFLFSKPEIIRRRIQERGGRAMEFLREPATINYIIEFQNLFARTYLYPSEYLSLNNSTRSPKESIRCANNFLNRNPETNKSNGLIRFLYEKAEV